MKASLFIICLGAALLFPAVAAFADDIPPRPFSVHDENRDGYLDRQEYSGIRKRRLQRLEQGYGRRWRRHFPLLEFDSIDTDNDGRISVNELGDAIGGGFRRGRHRNDGCSRERP